MGKIAQLNIQTICANSKSFKDCQQLVFDAKSISFADENLEAKDCCNSLPSTALSPLTLAARKTLDELKTVKGALSNQYVNSIEDFYHHTQLHRKRVKKLALELIKMYPDKFEGLTEHQVRLAMAEHDRAKISGLALADDKEQFYKKLYSGYQRNIDRPTIDKLNEVDQKYMNRAHEVIGLHESPNMSKEYKNQLAKKRKALKLIENVADFVDRGLSPVSEEEFGRKMTLASQFMKDPEEAKMAVALEKRYSKVIQGLEYTPPNKYQIRAIKFSMMLDSRKESLKLKSASKLISAKTLLHKVSLTSKKSATKLLKVLASKTATKAFGFIDILAGVANDMFTMGCTQTPGQHDWKKVNGSCKPVADLTPKFVEFIQMNESEQVYHLENDQYTCPVLNQVYETSKKAPALEECSPKSMVLNSGDVKTRVKYHKNGNINSIDLSGYVSLFQSALTGRPKKAIFDENGEVKSVCYKTGLFNIDYKCINDKNDPIYQDSIKRISQFIQSASFDINKARYCCQKKLDPEKIVHNYVNIDCN